MSHLKNALEVVGQGLRVAFSINLTWTIWHFFSMEELLTPEHLVRCVISVERRRLLVPEKQRLPAIAADNIEELTPVITQSCCHDNIWVFSMWVRAEEELLPSLLQFCKGCSEFWLILNVFLWIIYYLDEVFSICCNRENLLVVIMNIIAVDHSP